MNSVPISLAAQQRLKIVAKFNKVKKANSVDLVSSEPIGESFAVCVCLETKFQADV